MASTPIYDDNGALIYTIYDSFDELPSVDDLVEDDQVHYQNRTWKWDGGKWTLFSETTVGDINFTTQQPVKHEITTGNGEDINVNHFFDLSGLTQLVSSDP